MKFRFDYVPENELNPYKIIDEGEGRFKITDVKDKISKSGNEMLVLTMVLRDERGNTTLYDEYITANASYKINAISKAIGKPQIYSEKGELDSEELLGGRGTCVIATEKASNPSYKDRSIVARYVEKVLDAPQAIQTEPAATNQYSADFEDDSLPF